jgi:hypothetical protein
MHMTIERGPGREGEAVSSAMPVVVGRRSVDALSEVRPPQLREVPADIEAMRRTLCEVVDEVTAFRRSSDGWGGWYVGWDGVAGLIPVVGDVYALYATTVMMQAAIKAKCSLGTKLSGLGMMGMDCAMGLLPGAGDIADLLFRSHAWFGGMVLSDARSKIDQIEEHRRRLPHLSDEEASKEQTRLRDVLFHGGSSEAMRYARLGVVAVLCLVTLHECRKKEEARQETIRACEARGGWFCSVRN